MENEIMGKRTNGTGGSGSGSGNGAGRPPARNGARETVKVVEQLRDSCITFGDAAYITRGIAGVRGAAARRELADRLEFYTGLIPDLVALLRAEAIDMERGSQSVADDLPSEPKKKA